MYHYKTNISEEEHDNFVKRSSQVNLLQSSSWSKIKANWGNERLGFYKNEELVAVASILIKSLPLGLTMLYVPRGIVMNYQDEELVEFVISGLKEYGRSKRAVFIKFDPALLLKQYPINQSKKEQLENTSSLKAIDNLKKVGCHWSGLTVKMSDSIQPRYQANIYLKQNQQDTFPKHTKRLMKDAENRGVITYRGTLADIPDFAKVVSLTEKRKGVSLRNQNYFQKLMEIYGNNAYLHLAKIDLSKKLAEYRKNLEQVEESLSETVENQRKRRARLQQQKQSLEKYIKEFESFVQEYPDELIIAGILSISFGNTMEMLYAGMNEDFKRFYPQYLLYPKVFEDAHQNGIKYANMGGIEGTLDDGLTKFKSNFNPTVEEYIGEFTLPISILYKLANYVYILRKKLRSSK